MENLINKLINIGLTEYEAKTYFALLKKHSFTATELSKLTQVPRTKIYSVLTNLIQKGACSELPGKVRKFCAVNPDTAFSRILETLEERKTNIGKIAEELLPLYEAEKENSDPLEYIEVIRERRSIIKRIDQLEIVTKHEIVAMNKPPYAVDIKKMCEDNIPFDNKDITYKYLYGLDDIENPDLMKLFDIFEKNGVEIKVCEEEIPVKFVIFDNKSVMMSLNDNIPYTNSLTGLVITNSDFARLLRNTFNVYFETALSLAEYKIKLKKE